MEQKIKPTVSTRKKIIKSEHKINDTETKKYKISMKVRDGSLKIKQA